ncbi:hypothetical protein [Pelistega europaea]|uniref:Uncharacterized protein n=1 Tax=Pelistega europaea TaxID=106147 RepID=A0A7Y4L962_9BURK|nr:hypothetical protein [Pelistega europaea]NOL49270.1 hypothetical protein [Pelistega europaea]
MKDSLLRLVNAKTSLAEFVEIFAETVSFSHWFKKITEQEEKINDFLDSRLEFDEEADSVHYSDTFLSELPNHPKLKLMSVNFYKNIHRLSLVDIETGEVVRDIINTNRSFSATLHTGTYLNYIRCIFILYGEMLGDKNIANFPRIDKNTVEPEVYETIKDLVKLVHHKCVECKLATDTDGINIKNTILVDGFENNDPFF